MTQATAVAFNRYNQSNSAVYGALIYAAKQGLKFRVIFIRHHYQRADVYKHAGLSGNLLKLSKLAGQANARHILLRGVHFMAEVADIFSQPKHVAILPDVAAA